MPQQDKKSVIRELIELGKQKGQLTTQDILDATGDLDIDPDKIDKIYESIESQGIEIVDDTADLQIEDLDLNFEENKDDDTASPSADPGLTIDDPVKVYLKEIGRVPLLTSEEEIELAIRISDGDVAAKRKGLRARGLHDADRLFAPLGLQINHGHLGTALRKDLGYLLSDSASRGVGIADDPQNGDIDPSLGGESLRSFPDAGIF